LTMRERHKPDEAERKAAKTAPSGRPSGFPRSTWAMLRSREQQVAARRRWVTSRPQSESTAKQIVAEIIGIPRDGLVAKRRLPCGLLPSLSHPYE
jgi:hypothetical protein